jgi:hypothetical protein
MPPIKLNYSTPDTRRSDQHRHRKRLLDLIDALGGPGGVLMIVGLFAMLIGPNDRSWIGATTMVIGALIVETVLVVWLKR